MFVPCWGAPCFKMALAKSPVMGFFRWSFPLDGDTVDRWKRGDTGGLNK